MKVGAKLTADNVKEIRKLRGESLTQTEVGKQFGVSAMTISKIDRGINWKTKGSPTFVPHSPRSKKTISKEKIAQIIELRKRHWFIVEIEKETRISRGAINRILNKHVPNGKGTKFR